MKELILNIRLIGHSIILVVFFFSWGLQEGCLCHLENDFGAFPIGYEIAEISPRPVTVNHVQAYFIRLWQISRRKSKCTISALRSKITSVHFPKGKVFVRRWGTRAIWETSVTPLHYKSAERKAGMLLYRNKNAENIWRTQGHVLHKVHNNCWPVINFFFLFKCEKKR